ncbi:MAG: ABC transporter permease [Clostridia bacterium]|nr:ABC transporter permease [Clostridia bacterium]
MRYKNKVGGKVFLLLVASGILLWCMLAVRDIPDHLQYIVPAPKVQVQTADPAAAQSQDVSGGTDRQPNAELRSWQESLQDISEDWEGIIRSWSMDGVVEMASFTDGSGRQTVQGRLTALGTEGQALRNLLPRSGRLIYPEEMARGERVILLDEQLALKLFRISEPLDFEVVISGKSFRVVGILRHALRVGDTADFGAYIPLTCVYPLEINLDAVQVEAVPVAGSGAAVMLRAAMENWQMGGTFYDLTKEKMGAWLWLRVLLFLAGMVLIVRCIRLENQLVLSLIGRGKEKLRRKYAVRLLPEFFLQGILLAVGYGVLAFGAARLFLFMLEPVYIFPEWIPAVLVEWSDMQTAFWTVWKGFARMVEYRTPEIMRLRFVTLLVDGFSALSGVLLGMLYAAFRTSSEKVAASLQALSRTGVVYETVRTERVSDYERYGYAHLPGRDGEMVRAISVPSLIGMLKVPQTEGSFVLQVEDLLAKDNHRAWKIRCDGKTLRMTETGADWDMHTDVQTLTALLFSPLSFRDFLETYGGVELTVRMPLMDALFDQQAGAVLEEI